MTMQSDCIELANYLSCKLTYIRETIDAYQVEGEDVTNELGKAGLLDILESVKSALDGIPSEQMELFSQYWGVEWHESYEQQVARFATADEL